MVINQPREILCKTGKTVLIAFIEIVNEFNRKPNKLWVDQEREFYNKLMQEWLDNDDILMYFTRIMKVSQ